MFQWPFSEASKISCGECLSETPRSAASTTFAERVYVEVTAHREMIFLFTEPRSTTLIGFVK